METGRWKRYAMISIWIELNWIELNWIEFCGCDCEQAQEALHAQIAKSKPNTSPLQSSDLLDDAELLAEDRELDAELAGNDPINKSNRCWLTQPSLIDAALPRTGEFKQQGQADRTGSGGQWNTVDHVGRTLLRSRRGRRWLPENRPWGRNRLVCFSLLPVSSF